MSDVMTVCSKWDLVAALGPGSWCCRSSGSTEPLALFSCASVSLGRLLLHCPRGCCDGSRCCWHGPPAMPLVVCPLLTALVRSACCGSTYVGETGRTLELRLKEHQRTVKSGQTTNGIAVHANNTHHSILWDSAHTGTREKCKRLCYEPLFRIRDISI